MHRQSGSRVQFLLVCLVILWLGQVNGQDPFEDVLGSNSQLWKSFQDEMRTLEQAAHKVNSMLSNANHQQQQDDQNDQQAKAADNLPDTTVLASPSVMKDGVLSTKSEDKTENNNEKKDDSETGVAVGGGTKQPFGPTGLNFESLIHSLGFFKNLPEPWWKGKNVCVEKSEKIDSKNKGLKEENEHILIMGTGTFEHCKQTSGKYICTTVISTPQSKKTVSTTYQCCEGFRRQADGCVQVELKDVVDVLDSLGSKEFASLLRTQNMMQSLADKNTTIFAPVDSAMKSSHVEFQESNQIRERRVTRAVEEWSEGKQPNQLGRDIAMAHIVEKLLDVDDFSNEMVVNSSYHNSPLRINIYPGRMEPVMTVNCARITSWDNVASHARVHTVDRVLEPVSRSVMDILDQPQFSQFKQYLEQEDLLEVLRNASAITVFAPNNEAWDKLGAGLKDKYSRGEACIDRVLRHHVLPLTLCAAPVAEGRLSTVDLEGEVIKLARDPDGQLMVDDKGRVVQEDIVATNGVVHVLDKVLTPKSAKLLSELLSTSNHTRWLSLLDRAGLMDQLDRQHNLTMFVPTERVLADEATQALLDAMDSDTLRQVLLHHVVQQATPTCDLSHDSRLRTQAGTDLTVTTSNPYVQFFGMELKAAVQCAPLGHTDGKACHVVAHEVTRLLLPPNSTTLQLVADNPQLAVLKRVLKGTQLEKDLEAKTEPLADSFTLLAPTDDAFNKLDEELFSKILTDKKFADEVLRQHVLKEPVCCASITWPFANSVPTLSDRKIEMNRDRDNRVMFGDSAADKCDVITTDGIVHMINDVLLPKSSNIKLGSVSFGTPERKITLFGI